MADSFYPKGQKELSGAVDSYIKAASVNADEAQQMVGYVAPHAGYEYSGAVAGYTYKAISERKDLAEIDSFIVIGPNHTGNGAPIALSGVDWDTPLGTVRNDIELTRKIVENDKKILAIDENAHAQEHSVEVQLPFIQRIAKNPRCVFICMGDQSYAACVRLNDAISKASKELSQKIIVIASSDFNHYEPFALAKTKDLQQIAPLLEMDAKRFDFMLGRSGSSICGHGPIATSLLFSQTLGASKGILLKYTSSGDVNKDYESVVTYASIAFRK